jgi:glycosyltransferase involved in cell wall biosynthesis
MKVLQISKFYPPVMGGIESVAFELTEGMNRLGHRADVLCAHTGRSTRIDTGALGYTITRAGSFGMLLSTSLAPAMAWRARRICDGYDVIHVQMPDPMAALALWFARPPRAKIVLHWQSDVVNQRRALKLYEPLQRWLLGRADAIIATTPPYAASSPWLKKWQHKIEIIPNGISDVPPDDMTTRVERLRQQHCGKLLVFSLGRMTYYKGFDVLIDAAAALPDDCMVLVGGGGELLETYRAQVAARGLSGKIAFLGRISDQDTLTHYVAADVFCLASTVRAEAFGVVLLEAMAMSKPLVTTDIPGSGVPWINVAGVTGLTVPVGDAASLAAALELLLRNKDLAQRMGAAARQRFLEHFTAQRMVARTIDLYQRLLASPHRADPFATRSRFVQS